MSFVAAIIVAILVIAILGLVAWNVIGNIKAKINKVIQSVFQIGEYVVSFVTALAEFILTNSEAAKEKLITAIKNLVDVFKNFIGDVKSKEVGDLLMEKIDHYKDGAVEELYKINERVSKVISGSRSAQVKLSETMSRIDKVIVSGNFTDGSIRGLSGELILNILSSFGVDI